MLIDRIKKDRIIAMKEKDGFTKTILTTLIGEIEMVGKNNGNRKTTDDEAVKTIQKFKKNTEFTIESLQGSHNWQNCQGEVEELIDEVSIYEGYLPKMMSEEDLTKLISDMIDALPNPNIGMIMGQLKKSGYAYDGKTASKIIKEQL